MRKIIHIDMDCFFAAIEMRESPELKGQPIAVGGTAQSRGVVATCNYEARRYGIRSAMPMASAMRRCPRLVVLPVRMHLYREVSREILSLFYEYTDLVEPISLDEAFLDVSQSQLCRGSATFMAEQIRKRIFNNLALTASAGVAPNKFLAKVASEWNKPDGQYVVTPQQIEGFVYALPVKRIPGVGLVTAERLKDLNIHTCGDLQDYSLDRLSRLFGKFGERLYEFSRGIDNRPVKTSRIRKSLSVEDTFAKDLQTLEACKKQLPELYRELMRRLLSARQQQKLVIKSLFVKMRFHDFVTTTVQAVAREADIEVYKQLFDQAWGRGKRPVRLLGIGMQFGDMNAPVQMSLDLDV